ncbi:MAG: DNA-binding domain-containing protein [Xanthobacteraceae bacterium]|nr:DNA-binding domain-containing protein [Xanthobacteraceae bacterium]
MTRLTDFQQGFATAMLDVALPPPCSIRGAGFGSVARRFDIHRNRIATNLVQTLAERYPVTRRLIGPESFAAMAQLYTVHNPPRSPVLLDYGDTFPLFIRSLGRFPSIEYLADISDLELSLSRAYHAADAAPVSVDAFAQLSPDFLEDLVLSFHPSASLVASRFPIVSIWEAYRSEDEGQLVTLWAAEAALVARPDDEVRVWLLPSGGHAFLANLMKGATLAEATHAAADAAPDFDLIANLEMLISSRACIGIDSLALMAA